MLLWHGDGQVCPVHPVPFLLTRMGGIGSARAYLLPVRSVSRTHLSLETWQMGVRVMDSNDQERERGITILAKVPCLKGSELMVIISIFDADDAVDALESHHSCFVQATIIASSACDRRRTVQSTTKALNATWWIHPDTPTSAERWSEY